MSDTAFQTMYRDETIAGFEKSESLARKCVTTEFMKQGGSAVFLVADSGGATAVTRGNNGDIPTRPDNLNQYTAPLSEWHDVPEKTNFNIFASQGNQRSIMQRTSMNVINRKVDSDIHTALDTATVSWASGSAADATLANLGKALGTLGTNFADEGEVYALITPAFHMKMHTLNEFSSADYINDKKFAGLSRSKAFDWWGIRWVVDGGLPGAGTALSSNFLFNKSAIGHAADVDSMRTEVGYDGKNDKSWCRCSVFMASVLMQNSGVVKMHFNDTAYVIT